MQVIVESIVNTRFNSNTYLIKGMQHDANCYLIDIGNAEAVLKELEHQKFIKAIFLTHAHYDHICGLHKILEIFPECLIYCSKYTGDALQDSKMNLSFYQQTPFTYTGKNIKLIDETCLINLFENINIHIFETAGHNDGCLTFKIENAVFTGDSLIPHIPVVTKLKTGNKEEAQNSVLKIRNNTNDQDVIYPGHGDSIRAAHINWGFYLEK